ncbi:hypothetical protein RND81_06G220700 [Saponaria officinalis]|uniref:Uncharacterized protein n=1 Tax=Saponaria officinalis TaxID=3572 RepID=A0AAW1KDJ9_SAPOF
MMVDAVFEVFESEKSDFDMNVGVNGGRGNGSGDGEDVNVFVNDSDVNDHEVSVKDGGDGNVFGDVEDDAVENGVKKDVGKSKFEGGVDEEEENGEVKSRGEIVEVENCGSDGNVEGVVDVSTEVLEVTKDGDLETVVDEVKEGSVLGHVVDEVTESSEPKPVETSDNGNGSGIGSHSLDNDDNSEDNVSDAQKSVEVETDYIVTVNGVPNAPEHFEVYNSKLNDSGTQEPAEVPEVEADYIVTVNGVPDAPEHYEVYNSEHNVSGAQGSAEVETDDITTVNGVTDAPKFFEVEVQIETAIEEVPEGEVEANQPVVQPLENEVEIHGGESERLEDQVGKPEHEVTASNDDHVFEVPVSELETADCVATELKPIETSVGDESVENGITETRPLDGNADLKRLPLDDATSVEQSADSQQQNISPSHENAKQGLIEVEVKIDELGDVDAVAAGGSLESVDSEAAGCEIDLGETGEVTDQNGSDLSAKTKETTDLQSLFNNSVEEQNQCNLEFQGIENLVSVSVVESDESITNSISGVEESSEASSADMQFDMVHESAVGCTPEKVFGDEESEAMAEVGGSQKASPGKGVLHDEIAEMTGSFDLIDSDISSEDCSTEKTSTAEDQNDHGGSDDRDDISESKVVPASDESLEDDGSCVSEDKNISLDTEVLSTPCDTDNVIEQGVVNDVYSAADNCPSGSVDDNSSQTILEKKCPIPYPVHDSKSGTKSVNNEVDAGIKSNYISDEDLMPKISFGSFDFISPFAHDDINLGSTIPNKSSEVGTSSSESKLFPSNGVALPNSQADSDHFARLNHDTACAQVAQPEQINEGSVSSAKRSEADFSDSRNTNPDFARSPFYWLIKIPRADEGNYHKQLRESEIGLTEKTNTRNAFQAQFNHHQNTLFNKAKNDLRVAYNYAAAGKKDSLESHCLNQVEEIMEMWNTNDEFRKQYIHCNTRRMLWKFGTFDDRQLGINEVPPSLGYVSDNRVRTSAEVKTSTAVLTLQKDVPVDTKVTEDKSSKKVERKKAAPTAEKNEVVPRNSLAKVSGSIELEKALQKDLPVDIKVTEDKSSKKVGRKKTAPTAEKNEVVPRNSLAKVSGSIEIEEAKEETILMEEEKELARKAEHSRREEEAARLWEQRKLEEKTKAEKALERKRRNALKAQARADFRARKEAEEREKARDLREKKKQTRRGVDISENEPAQPSEPSSKSIKEPDVTEKTTTMAKQPKKAFSHTKPIKTIKPIPAALRNKGKRGLLRYWPYAFIVLLAVGLFYLGSFERIQTIKQLVSGSLHW